MKQLLITLLLIGSVFATNTCVNQSVPVCGSNYQNYANEPNATAAGTLTIFCGTCANYQLFASSWNTWNASNASSQYNTSNRSYLERFVSSSFGALIGNDEYGQPFMAIIVGGFFFVFVSFQNTRVEGKAAVLIPAALLAAVFVGWLLTLIALAVGVLFYMALSKIMNK
jgi:hypothetical protein